MKQYHYLLLAALVLKTSVLFADLKGVVQEATTNYLQNHFLNASFMFADTDDTIVLGAHGFYDLDGTHLMPDQKMPIASVTKTMTAVAILKLQERELLNVHNPVVKYLDESIWPSDNIPKWAYKVKVHNLLTHTSGLEEYLGNMEIDTKTSHGAINKAIISFVSTKPLEFEPGRRYQYSNTNFVLLGLIIEKVSGMPLADFFRQELFEPLGMKSTHLASLEEALKIQSAPRSVPYPERYFVIPNNEAHPTFKAVQPEHVLVPYADGGVISNVRDLIKWNRALHEGNLLSDASYQLMIKRYMKVPNKTWDKVYTGYGLFITELNDKDVMYHNSGDAVGIKSESGYIPEKDFYFAVLSNVTQSTPEDMKDKIDISKPENQLDIIYFVKAILKAVIDY